MQVAPEKEVSENVTDRVIRRGSGQHRNLPAFSALAGAGTIAGGSLLGLLLVGPVGAAAGAAIAVATLFIAKREATHSSKV